MAERNDSLTAVCVMAGGIGERFWPLSRTMRPKQLLAITGEKTMLRETISRHEGIAGPENTFIVTNEAQADLIRQEIKELPFGTIFINMINTLIFFHETITIHEGFSTNTDFTIFSIRTFFSC